MGSGVKRSYAEGFRLLKEIIRHNNNSGGVTVGIFGSKGSGKTTFLLTLADKIGCYDPFTQDSTEVEFETIIWRGRDADYWTWLDKRRVTLFIHRDDLDTVEFKNDLLEKLDDSILPTIKTYTSIKSLYTSLVKGGINVIYEPRTYKITPNIKKMIQKRGITGDDLFKTDEVDPVIFWFELMYWLVKNKTLDFITIIFDEADELFPTSPAGARWHLNLWAKDVIKDLRKRNITLIIAAHAYTDIDGRIMPKLQYKIYMKGCVTPSTSLVSRQAPLMLHQGLFYIERDAWGLARFDKITEQPRVLVMFPDDDNGGDDDLPDGPPDDTPPDYGDDHDDDDSRDDDDTKPAPPKKKKAGTIKGIPPEIVRVDKSGKLVIDLTNLNLSDDEIKLDTTPPKKTRKSPSQHKGVNRKTNNTTARKTRRDYGGK
ncbi:MAG: hypothetical protein PHR28_14100 [candidate division Zixibacteria bacterium]|jgi:hypothetical protein|nr:hypothetical protein [candidate division Zixibacteria bacterium]